MLKEGNFAAIRVLHLLIIKKELNILKIKYVLDVEDPNIKIQKYVKTVENKTLGYFVTGHKYLSSKCQEIRAHARKMLENSDREKVCQYCRNHEFDEILEVHHLKSILKFDESTLISEINNKDNLV